jgi:hypothetical protein
MMARMALLGLTASVLALPCALRAQNPLDAVPLMPRDPSCTPVATAQNRGCEVDTIFNCSQGDLEYQRIETYTVDGLDTISLDDPASGALAIGDPHGDYMARMTVAPGEMTSPAEMIAAGSGSLRYTGFMTVWGIQKPLSAQSDMVVDGQITVSGLDLIAVRSNDTLVMPSPVGPISGVGYMYFHAETGLVFSGEGTDPFHDPEAKEMTVEGRPAEIHFPGSDGFGSTTPSYDCGEFSTNHLSNDQAKEAL